MDFLLLTTPAQHTSSNPAVELELKSLKNWIEELPVMNIMDTVRQLHQAIEPFNELQLDDSQRLKLLEVYHQAFEDTLCFYDELRLHQLPIPREQRKSLAGDIMWLYLELANGYKMIVSNNYRSGSSNINNSKLLLVMYRAMELIIQGIIYAYHVHESPPPLAYLEIHQLYLLAEYFGNLNTPIKAIKGLSRTPTIEHLYRQFLLLVSMEPYKFEGSDIFKMFFLLDEFANHCVVSKEAPLRPPSGKYILDMMDDKPPRFCKPEEHYDPTPNTRVLDVDNTLAAVKSRIQQNTNSPQSLVNDQEQQLLKALVNQLKQRTNRNESRIASKRSIDVTFGMAALNYFLTHKERLAQARTVEACAGIEVRSFDSEDEAEHGLSHWTLENESENGCLLVGQDVQLIDSTHVGDLAGMVDNSSGKSPVISVGVIRWRRIENNTLKLGLERLAGKPVAVELLQKNHLSGPTRHTGLYFPRGESSTKPATLLTERSLLASGATLQVVVNGNSQLISPVNLVAETPVFAQFTFRVAAQGLNA